MARFSARPTMPPRAICASFLASAANMDFRAAASRLVPSSHGGGDAGAVLPRALRPLRARARARPRHGARTARRLGRPLLRVPRQPDRVARGGRGEEGHAQREPGRRRAGGRRCAQRLRALRRGLARASRAGGARGPGDHRRARRGGRAERFAREAARQALTNLTAADAPAGTMTVVLGPGWPGVLLHEAIGHGLEGDFNRKHVSAFTDRIGTRVASELCTVVDDGTIADRRGSLNVDDEGTPTQRTVLIEKGILRGYLQDRLNASLMGMPLTGNGRRE